MGIWRNKRGALELSINAIVVLILAITILGLGIAFIRGQFGALQEQFQQVSGEVKTELTNKIRESGELLVFSQGELDVQTGKKQSVYYGIQNTAQKEACFYVVVRCLGAQNSDNPEECSTGINVGQVVAGPNALQLQRKWMSLLSPIDINGNDVGVYPLTIQISGTRKDTYLMELVVASHNSLGDPEQESNCRTVGSEPAFNPDDGLLSEEWNIHARKQFYINLN